MPKKYLEMKRQFIKEGMTEEKAMRKAARIYNAQRKSGQEPVTRKKKVRRRNENHKRKASNY